jgi:hypothetical protein
MGDAPTLQRFSDFADPTAGPLDGDKVKIDDVLGKEIILHGFRVKASRYKDDNPDYLTLQFAYQERPDERFIIFTGSTVLQEQLEKYKDRLPFLATIKKVDRFYTLT